MTDSVTVDSQAAEECESCGEVDYGDKPGYPGYDWCADNNFDCGGCIGDRDK